MNLDCEIQKGEEWARRTKGLSNDKFIQPAVIFEKS